MSTYTTQLRHIVESGTNIFDFDYPMFDPLYKSVLEQKIIDTYYFREIGFETAAQFIHFLKTRMSIIMPYYNHQYLQFDRFIKLDPYVNKDITTTETRTTDQERENDNKSSVESDNYTHGNVQNKDSEVFSDTPQGKLITDNYATNVTERDISATNQQGTHDKSTGTATNNENIKTIDEYIQHIQGFDGMKYASDVYQDIRDVLINIDEQIIKELNDLFMNIY